MSTNAEIEHCPERSSGPSSTERRSLRIYAADHTAGEPSAKIRGLIAYFVNAVAGGRNRREIREGKLGTGQRSQIAADTDHA